ncbi:MAG TPA: hypothetical protein VMD98_13920 [Bryocella sp.]|nr:hypothetical protein [Bryocella sp.]
MLKKFSVSVSHSLGSADAVKPKLEQSTEDLGRRFPAASLHKSWAGLDCNLQGSLSGHSFLCSIRMSDSTVEAKGQCDLPMIVPISMVESKLRKWLQESLR